MVKSIQYPAVTEPVPLDPSLQVAPVFAESWMQPFSEPIFLSPFEHRYLFDSFFGQTLDSSLHVRPIFAEEWIQPIEQPVLPIEYRYLLDSVFGQPLEDGLVAAFSTFGWEMQPQSQPVLGRELSYLHISTFAQIDPGDFVVPPVSDEVAPRIVRIGAYGLLHGAGKTPIGRGF